MGFYQIRKDQENDLPQLGFYLLFYSLLISIEVLIWNLLTTALPTDTSTYTFSGLHWSWDFDTSEDQWMTFNWHPILMVTAFGFFFPQAAVAYKILPWSHNVNKLVHFCLQTMAFVLSTTAIIVAFRFKYTSGNKNMYTAHAWLGFLAYSLFGIQYVGGLFLYGIPQFAPLALKKAMMPYHVFAGFSIFFLTCGAIFAGITDREVLCCWTAEGITSATLVGDLIMLCLVGIAGCVFWIHRPRKYLEREEIGLIN